MPYNKQTALENQKAFLKSQMHSGYPNIEKRAKEQLEKLEKFEKEQEEFNKRIRESNQRWLEEREKKRLIIKPKLKEK